MGWVFAFSCRFRWCWPSCGRVRGREGWWMGRECGWRRRERSVIGWWYCRAFCCRVFRSSSRACRLSCSTETLSISWVAWCCSTCCDCFREPCCFWGRRVLSYKTLSAIFWEALLLKIIYYQRSHTLSRTSLQLPSLPSRINRIMDVPFNKISQISFIKRL